MENKNIHNKSGFKNIETDFVMVKPIYADIPEVIDEIKRRLAEAGLKIDFETTALFDKQHAKVHYSNLANKPFFGEVIDYITSGPVYAMQVSGKDAISITRDLVGDTKNPVPGTIRYDIPVVLLSQPIRIMENVVHASDSKENAEKELDNLYDLIGLSKEK